MSMLVNSDGHGQSQGKVNLVTHQEASKALWSMLDLVRSPLVYSFLLSPIRFYLIALHLVSLVIGFNPSNPSLSFSPSLAYIQLSFCLLRSSFAFPFRPKSTSFPFPFPSLHFPLSVYPLPDHRPVDDFLSNSRRLPVEQSTVDRDPTLQLLSAASATSTTIWAAWDPHQTSGTSSTPKRKKDTPLIEHFSSLLSLVFMILAFHYIVMMLNLMDSEQLPCWGLGLCALVHCDVMMN